MNTNIFEYFNMDENLGQLINYRDFQIKSWCSDIPNIKKLLLEIGLEKKLTIVEIGVHGGGSLLLTYDLIQNTDSVIIGIDCWERITENKINGIENDFWSNDSLEKFLNLHKNNRILLETIVNTYDNKNQIKLIHGFSNDTKILELFEKDSIDILYIDGDHSFNGCYSDLKNWYPKVKKNGFIINDDFSWSDVNKAINTFCSEIGVKNLIIDGNQSFFQKLN
jgi:cephalosporin hydroxylase